MSRGNKEVTPTPAGEHIFPATQLTALAIKWKELMAQGRTREAAPILEEIIIGSTKMFERFAQHEHYHLSVDLGHLVSAAQEKMARWLTAWDPKFGKLFSFINKCCKHAFQSEVLKAVQYRNRFYAPGDNLETFFGSEDHAIDKADLEKELKEKLTGIHVRWGSPEEIGAMRFLIESLVMEHHDKHKCLRTCGYAWGISPDMGKFFYRSALVTLRHLMYDRSYQPFTEQDLFRHEHSYSLLVDMLEIISWDQMKKIIVCMGGNQIKIPTTSQMKKLHDNYELFREVEGTDLDPASIKNVAKKRRKSYKSAQETYEEMFETLNPNRSGEYPLYPE